FRAMDGLPVTVRTLDPPLHEFLPRPSERHAELAELLAKARKTAGDRRRIGELEDLLPRVLALAEANPMLGWRGCRLTIVHPEILQMQARAIFEAAAKCIAEGVAVRPE